MTTQGSTNRNHGLKLDGEVLLKGAAETLEALADFGAAAREIVQAFPDLVDDEATTSPADSDEAAQ
jgi:hypothetical protein